MPMSFTTRKLPATYTSPREPTSMSSGLEKGSSPEGTPAKVDTFPALSTSKTRVPSFSVASRSPPGRAATSVSISFLRAGHGGSDSIGRVLLPRRSRGVTRHRPRTSSRAGVTVRGPEPPSWTVRTTPPFNEATR